MFGGRGNKVEHINVKSIQPSLNSDEPKLNQEGNDKMNNDFSALNILVNSFKKACSETTAHGIPNIERSEHFIIKLFWIFLLLIAFGASGFFCYSTFVTFFQYGVTVSVELEIESPITFPAITLCNVNAFDTSEPDVIQTIELMQSRNLIPKIEPGINPNDLVDIIYTALKVFVKKSNTESLRKKPPNLIRNAVAPGPNFPYFNSTSSTLNYSNNAINTSKSMSKPSKPETNNNNSDLALPKNSSNSNINTNIGFNLKNMLLSCKFDGKTCNYTDFISFYSFEYGNCYIFNKKGTQDLKTVGKTKIGLQVELFAGISGNYSNEKGIYVSIHNNSMIPMTKYEGIKVSVGTSTDIGITRTFRYKLDKPYSDCRKDISNYKTEDSNYFKYILKELNSTQYSRKLCYEVCYQDMAKSQCNCTDPTNLILLDAELETCRSLEQINCVDQLIEDCDKSSENCECSSKCPLECDTVVYSLTTSSSLYPTEYYYGLMKTTPQVQELYKRVNLSFDIFKNSVAKINIFYSDIYHAKISESPSYQPFDLIGLIGGVLGLFLG